MLERLLKNQQNNKKRCLYIPASNWLNFKKGAIKINDETYTFGTTVLEKRNVLSLFIYNRAGLFLFFSTFYENFSKIRGSQISSIFFKHTNFQHLFQTH